MFFTVDPGGDVPIYEQIVRQIQMAVAGGLLTGGQMVPSVRQLAVDLAINPNTIAKAYTQLQNEKVLEPLRGRGLIVRRDALARCKKARDRSIAASLSSVIDDAARSGVPADDLRQLFEAQLAETFSPSDPIEPSDPLENGAS